MKQFNSNKPGDWALYLFEELGFKVFPLSPNSKIPPKGIQWQSWAKEATRDKIISYATSNPTANWGIDCEASGLIVIDVDNKGDKKGSESLALLNLNLTKTLTIKTPSGGFHYFYKGQCRSTTSKVADGVDTKSRGGYVVAPGSKIDRVFYEIIDNRAISNIDQNFMDLMKVDKEPVVLKDDEVIQEGTRTNTILSLAGAMRRKGFSKEAILAAISIENERLVPPLTSRELESIAKSVAKYSPELASAGVDFSELNETDEGPKSLKDFEGEPPRRAWLVKDWIPMNEISSLYGSGGTGKSLLSLQLAMAVATGTKFLGLDIEHKIPTMCVFCEDSNDEVHRRVHSIINAPEFEFNEGLSNTPIKLWARVGLNNDIARLNDKGNDLIEGPFRATLEAELSKMPKGPKLVILDTLSDIYLGDENTREKVNKFVKTHIGSLVKDYNLTVLLLAHPSRSGQNTRDMLSGSTAWENAVRNRLAFIPHENLDGIMVLKRMKSNYAKRGEEILLSWNEGRFILAGSANDIHKRLEFEVVSLLIKLGLPKMLLKDFAEAVLADDSLTWIKEYFNKSRTSLEFRIKNIFKLPVCLSGVKVVVAKGFIVVEPDMPAENRPIAIEDFTKSII